MSSAEGEGEGGGEEVGWEGGAIGCHLRGCCGRVLRNRCFELGGYCGFFLIAELVLEREESDIAGEGIQTLIITLFAHSLEDRNHLVSRVMLSLGIDEVMVKRRMGL